MKKLIFFICLFALPSMVISQGINFFHGSFDEAISKAKAENKLLFLDCYTSWCGPCKMLQNNVFPQENIGAFYNQNFICYKVDCEKGEGPSICSRYSVNAYPTMHFIDGNTGKSVYKTMGYQVAETLIEKGKIAMGGNSNLLREYQTKYQNGDKSAENLLGLVIELAKNGQTYDAYLKEYIATQSAENIRGQKNASLIFQLTSSINSPAIGIFQELKKYYIETLGMESYQKKVEQIASLSVKEATQKSDKSMFQSTLTFLKNNDLNRSEEVVLKESMQFYKGTNDMLAFDKVATKYLKSYKKNDSKLFAEVASLYVEKVSNPTLLAKAVNWAIASIKIEDKYYNNIVLAQLLNLQGKKSEAFDVATHALESGKKEKANYWPAQELLNKIQIEWGKEKSKTP
jgi:thiol-disulfide isomerase/thioredoxin